VGLRKSCRWMPILPTSSSRRTEALSFANQAK
jgi:hypothetical protein